MPFPSSQTYPEDALFPGFSADIDLNGIAAPPLASATTYPNGALVPNQLAAGIPSAEVFGAVRVPGPPQTVGPSAVVSAESVGSGGLVLKDGWRARLRNPYRVDRYRLPSTASGIQYVTNTVAFTVYYDGAMRTVEAPQDDVLQSAQYVWRGGHDNITSDVAVLYLWLANNLEVEII